MAVRAHLANLFHDVLHLDRSQMQPAIAARNAIGVVIPLAIGILTGHILAGLTCAIGAIQVAMSDRPEPFRLKLGRMLLASGISAISVFVGSATGAIAWLAIAVTMFWGFAGGLLMAIDPDAGPFALAGMILVIVMANQPHDPGRAAQLAGLVFLGGALQTALAIIPFSTRRMQAERAALADVYRQLAGYARIPPAPTSPPPATVELAAAHRLIDSLHSSHDPLVENLRSLLNQTERIRTELIGLVARGEQLPGAADRLETIAGVLTDQQDAEELALSPGTEDLTTQLRAAARITREICERTTGSIIPNELRLPWRLRLHSPLATLRANLSLHSAALRHALRLAICLGIADGLARGLDLPRGYWLPMTAALVLRPDFTTTFERGAARIVGTGLGLVLATILVHLFFAGQWEQIVLIGLLFFLVRIFGPTNYGWLSIAVTGLIVVLLAFAGAPPGPTMADRAIDTLLGGALALLTFLAWPTWERRRVPGILADLLVAYRDYFEAVMIAYLGPGQTPAKLARLNATRLAARLARSNAEASVDRLQSEPVRSEAEVARALAILAGSHRFVISALALEADLQHAPRPTAVGPLLAFADEVTTTLNWLAQAVHDGTPPGSPLPDLRSTARRLVRKDNQPAPAHPHRIEIERIVNSLSILTAVIAPAAKISDPPSADAAAKATARRPAGAG